MTLGGYGGRDQLRIGDKLGTRQARYRVDIMLCHAADRLDREILRYEIFDGQRGHDIVVGLGLGVARQADRVDIDGADRPVRHHDGAQQLHLDVALFILSRGRRGQHGGSNKHCGKQTLHLFDPSRIPCQPPRPGGEGRDGPAGAALH